MDAIINESILLELNVSTLYLLYYEQLENDAAFWWKLSEEESNHASLLRSARDYFSPLNQFPEGLIADNFNELHAVNLRIEHCLSLTRSQPPDRKTAFNTAYALELSAGEIHFQKFMEHTVESRSVESIFRRLNRDDQLHADRIKSYMSSHNIPFETSSSLI